MLTLHDKQRSILKKLIDHGRLKISELAEEEQITVATIHNYRASLENFKVSYERGYINLENRENGDGASFLDDKLSKNRVLRDRAIAYALDHFGPSVEDFVFFDGGTTQYLVFKQLIQDGPTSLSLITNNPLIVHECFNNPYATEKNRVFVVGGKFDRLRASFYGPHTTSSLNVREIRAIQFDLCFLGVVGVLADGKLSIGNDEEIPQKKLLVRKSKRVLIIVDQSKIGKRSWASFGRIDEIIRAGKEVYLIIGHYKNAEDHHYLNIQKLQQVFGTDIIRTIDVCTEDDSHNGGKHEGNPS